MSILGLIDHTLLRADALPADLDRLCGEAKEYGFASVAVNGAWVRYCAERLKGSAVKVDAAVGFPLGQTTTECKVFEAGECLKDGAGEIDYVVNVSRVRMGDLGHTREEMERIVRVCREAGALCKVIFETCYLTDDQKRGLCRIASEVGPDFIKTSTGFGPSGATAEDVRLMRESAASYVRVKASGGVRDLEAALRMIEAGAARIGTSAGVAIARQLAEKEQER